MSKTYVITGSTSGIGNELLKELSKNSIVFAGYRNEKMLDNIKNVNADNIIPFHINMTDSNSIEEAAKFILSKTQNIDRLINVAGCVVAGAVEEINIEKMREQFEVNTFSHLDFTQRLLTALDGGRIINISSMASYGVFPFVAPYCASKRALDILFNSLQIEYGSGIKIISIKPGVIATPLWEKSIEGNLDLLLDEKKYKKEYNYLVDNAKDNEKNGLNVKDVVKVVLKADCAKCPKASYTVGFDAFVASKFAMLPQGVINTIVRLGLKLKIK